MKPCALVLAWHRRVMLTIFSALFAAALTLLALLSGLTTSPAHAQASTGVIRVATTGGDTPGCGGTASPCATVQYAVDQAQPGDEIRVAAGVYTGVQGRPAPANYTGPSMITQVVYLSKTVTVRGGYTPANWDTPDPVANPTTLDAQGQGRVFFVSGWANPIIEDLRIVGGDAIGQGGGLFEYDAGGGLYLSSSAATVNRNAVVNNSAYYGGGLYLSSSAATVSENTVISNTARDSGGGLYLDKSAAMVSGNTVVSNTAHYAGGGLYLSSSTATVSGNAVTGNTVGAYSSGGGLYLTDSPAMVAGNSIISNTAGYGGGLYLYESIATLDNNLVVANTSMKGSGVFLYSPAAGLTRLRHNTLARNAGGAGVYVRDNYGGGSSVVSMTNTILVGHTTGIEVVQGGAVRLQATLWGNDVDWILRDDSSIVTGTVNLWAEPGFVNPDAGDYHLLPTSPAIDAGVDVEVFADLDGEPRPAGMGHDIGADELPGPALRLMQTTQRPAYNAGETFDYTVVISNPGLDFVSQLRFTDSLSLTQRPLAVNAATGCTLNPAWGGGVSCDLGDLAPGTSIPLTLTVELTDVVPGPLPYAMDNRIQARGDNAALQGSLLTRYLHDCHVRVNGALPEYSQVQRALDVAQTDDTVQVAGTCVGVSQRAGMQQVAYLEGCVMLRGGYSVDFTEWNPATYPTKLDALGAGRGVYVAGAFISMVEGLHITGGDATRQPHKGKYAKGYGGGIFVEQAGVISGCTVYSNTALYGGGVYLDVQSQATIHNNTVASNTARRGGGLYLDKSPSTVSGNVVTSNTARYDGGGLYLDRSLATVSGNTVASNTANSGGGGLYLSDSRARLSGNTVISNTAGDYSGGGGLYLHYSPAMVEGNTIAYNTAGSNSSGGGLYLYESAANVSDNTITGNTIGAYSSGGGLYLAGSPATVEGNVVMSNTADWGGGLSLHESAATVSDNTVTGNIANNNGGGLDLSSSPATVDGNVVISNTARWGGGLSLYESAATVSNNAVASNTADSGGGMALSFSDAMVSGNTVTHNTARTSNQWSSGGGLYLFYSDAMVSGNTVTHNTARSGGGIFLRWSSDRLYNNLIADNQASHYGAGLTAEGVSLRLLHNTLARNHGGDGSGVYVTGYEYDLWTFISSNIALTNTILVSHTMGITVAAGNTATLESTLWHANGANTGGTGVITSTHAISGDPAFAGGNDYHLSASSAAVDAGIDSGLTTDIDGDPRPAAFGYDIGADEWPGPALRLEKRAWRRAANVGDILTYTVLVTSTGEESVTNVLLTDTLPLSQRPLTTTTSWGSCTQGIGWGASVTCNLGDMAVGAMIQITFTVAMTTEPEVLPLRVRNTAWVQGDNATNDAFEDVYIHDCHVRINGGLPEHNSVQAAVDVAQAGDTVQIAGTCVGVEERVGLRQVVYLDKTLTLRGGYSTDFANWDPETHPTTLDARGEGRVIYVTGTISPSIEGLHLTGGDATGLGGHFWDSWEYNAGGGVYVYAAKATISGCMIYSNTASTTDFWYGVGYGGGLFFHQSDVQLDNNFVTNNEASGSGVGLYVAGSSLRLRHNTIARNAGGDGSGIYVIHTWRGAPSWRFSTVALTNTILVSHTVGIVVVDDSTAALNGTLWGNETDWKGAGVIIGSHNYWGNPAFLDPDADDYHINPGSMAIDRGTLMTLASDVDGAYRPQGQAPDLGADETPGVGLVIDKTGPAVAQPGELVTYTLTVGNRGQVPMTGSLFITDIVPAGAHLVGQPAREVLSWTVDVGCITGTSSVCLPWQVSFAVTASQTITNDDYGVRAGELAVKGRRTVVTRIPGWQVFLPVIVRGGP